MNRVIPDFNKEDFVFTFGSQGTTFIFEDLTVSHYMNWASVTLGNREGVRVFVPIEEVKRMNKVGESLTTGDIQQKADAIQEVVQKIEKELPGYQQRVALSKEELTHVFELLAQICRAYSYFDVHYSDGMWYAAEDNKEAKKVSELVEKYKNEIREKLEVPFFTTDGWLATALSILSKQFEVAVSDLQWHREEELVKLFDGEMVSTEGLGKRKDSYAYYINESNERIFYSGEDAKKLDKIFSIESAEVATEIKGIVAHGLGKKVKGKVKIIRRDYSNPQVAKDFMESMNKGDIFVSETTDPELIDGLRKAGAIVVDVGGLLSHAAITARELDTPCIVGTEVGSKILKDGDEVEVDADSGIVRISKKGK